MQRPLCPLCAVTAAPALKHGLYWCAPCQCAFGIINFGPAAPPKTPCTAIWGSTRCALEAGHEGSHCCRLPGQEIEWDKFPGPLLMFPHRTEPK